MAHGTSTTEGRATGRITQTWSEPFVPDGPPPPGAPTITGVSPNPASLESTVTVTGTDFTGVTNVTLAGNNVTYSVVSSTSITFTAPGAAVTGKVRVFTPAGTAVQSDTLAVTPTSTGTAPVYSSKLTRRSMGVAGKNSIQVIEEYPGAAVHRTPVSADFVCNYSGGETTYTWGPLDAQVQKLFGLGIEPAMNCTYNLPAYSGWGSQMAVPTRYGVANNDANGHTFAQWITWYSQKFCKAVVNRYHKDGANKAPFITDTNYVKFYTVWNEPNNWQFWMPNNYTYDAAPSAGEVGIRKYSDKPYDYADLMAACYKEMKSVSADVVVGTGGTAVLGVEGTSDHRGWKSWTWYDHLIKRWKATITGTVPNGWSVCQCDFVTLHVYMGGDHVGKSGSASPPSVKLNAVWNALCTDPPMCHNLFHAEGWGSVLIWADEGGFAHDTRAVTGYGWMGDPVNMSYIQKAVDRQILSCQEAHDQHRATWRLWFGDDSWPTGTGTGYTQVWAAGSPKLGPKFLFAGYQDFHPTTTPASPENHYGMYPYNSTTKKTKSGVDNDAWDYILSIPKKP